MEKHLRKSRKRRERNKDRRLAMSRARRAFDEALEGGDAEEIVNAYQAAQKAFDKAARHNVITDNRAARLKSQMTKQMQEAGVELG